MKKFVMTRGTIFLALVYSVLSTFLLCLIVSGPVRRLLDGDVEFRSTWEPNERRYFPELALCPVPGYRTGFTPSWVGWGEDAIALEDMEMGASIANSSHEDETWVHHDDWKEVASSVVSGVGVIRVTHITM